MLTAFPDHFIGQSGQTMEMCLQRKENLVDQQIHLSSSCVGSIMPGDIFVNLDMCHCHTLNIFLMAVARPTLAEECILADILSLLTFLPA